MRARLLCRTGELSGKTHPLTTETVIGRGDGSNVVIASHLISGRHACIRQDSKGFILEDLGSANGTWVDGERVVQPVRLDRLNVITLARVFDLIFQVDADLPASAPTAPKPTSVKPVAPTPMSATPMSATPMSATPISATPRAPTPIAATPVVAMPVAGKPTTKSPVVPPRRDVAAPALRGAEETQFLGQGFDMLPVLEPDAPPAVGGETMELAGVTGGVSALPPELVKQREEMGGRTMHLDGPFDLPPLEPEMPAAATVRYSLEISGTGIRTQTVELAPRRRYTIGRAVECDILLDEEGVSRHHATVTVGDVVLLEDLGSSNGTHIDGRPLTTPVEIAPGSTFMLGLTISVKLMAR